MQEAARQLQLLGAAVDSVEAEAERLHLDRAAKRKAADEAVLAELQARVHHIDAEARAAAKEEQTELTAGVETSPADGEEQTELLGEILLQQQLAEDAAARDEAEAAAGSAAALARK